jgi:hypothetical protein
MTKEQRKEKKMQKIGRTTVRLQQRKNEQLQHTYQQVKPEQELLDKEEQEELLQRALLICLSGMSGEVL